MPDLLLGQAGFASESVAAQGFIGQLPIPRSAADAVGMARAGLAWLAGMDASGLTVAEQADCLRALEQAESVHTAARSVVLTAFSGCCGYQDDGHGSARTWLRWRTRITNGAASGAVGWMRRLGAHPGIGRALAAGEISCSWARQLCAWIEVLPEAAWEAAERILLAAAADGAELADLAALAEEIRRRTARPDADGDDDGFAGRGLRLGVTFGGAGRLEADLSAGCAAALAAVLEALGKRAGPEDLRTKQQRDHDALEEACRRIVSAGGLPDRAGQPTQIILHMTLDELRKMDGAGCAQDAWTMQHRSRPGWLSGPGAQGAACDATIVPVVSGHIDPDVLNRLTAALHRDTMPADSAWRPSPEPTAGFPAGWLWTRPPRPAGHTERTDTTEQPGSTDRAGPGWRPGSTEQAGPGMIDQKQWTKRAGSTGRTERAEPTASADRPEPTEQAGQGLAVQRDRTQRDMSAGLAERTVDADLSGQDPRQAGPWVRTRRSGDAGPQGCAGHAGDAGRRAGVERAERAEREMAVRAAADLLSGPTGLAAFLRRGRLSGPAASVSLPLDIGAATETIPAHLRRAVTVRDRHCRFPGCEQQPAACHVHHVAPRAAGGATSLGNMLLLCSFHHLTAVHRWGWRIILHADGAVTATSPDGTRTLPDGTVTATSPDGTRTLPGGRPPARTLYGDRPPAPAV